LAAGGTSWETVWHRAELESVPVPIRSLLSLAGWRGRQPGRRPLVAPAAWRGL